MRVHVLLLVIGAALCLLSAVASAPQKSKKSNGKQAGDATQYSSSSSSSRRGMNNVERPPKGKGRKGGKKVDKCNAELLSASPEKACHSEAVRKCGKNFISHLRKKQGPDGKVPYKDKCHLREIFLNCVTDSRKKPCRPRGRVVKPSHREEMRRVADHLWSTRGCLLGIDA